MERPLWVFAYGSLMWRPDFAFVERVPALLHGYHRAPCVLAIRYRGTPERPGLVVGLDRGGSCRGIAYRVAEEHRHHVWEYLVEREMITRVYRPAVPPLRLGDGRRARAVAFVVRRDHPQYAGGLSDAEAARIIAGGVGDKGTSREYFANTITHLDALGIREGRLHRILRLADALEAERLNGGRSEPITPQSPASQP